MCVGGVHTQENVKAEHVITTTFTTLELRKFLITLYTDLLESNAERDMETKEKYSTYYILHT